MQALLLYWFAAQEKKMACLTRYLVQILINLVSKANSKRANNS